MTKKSLGRMTETPKALVGSPPKTLPMYRHGDVLIARVEALPEEAEERGGSILARGEFTGHSHRIQETGAVQLWNAGGQTYLEVLGDHATLVHEEHKPIVLSRGVYRFWMQREYTPQAIVRVVD